MLNYQRVSWGIHGYPIRNPFGLFTRADGRQTRQDFGHRIRLDLRSGDLGGGTYPVEND